MKNTTILIALLTLFSTSNAIIVKNNTNKEMFVIATYKDSNIRKGIAIHPGCNKEFERVYIGRFDIEDYTYPNRLFFYNSFDDIQYHDMPFKGIYFQRFSNYLHRLKLTREDNDKTLTILSFGNMLILSMRIK